MDLKLQLVIFGPDGYFIHGGYATETMNVLSIAVHFDVLYGNASKDNKGHSDSDSNCIVTAAFQSRQWLFQSPELPSSRYLMILWLQL